MKCAMSYGQAVRALLPTLSLLLDSRLDLDISSRALIAYSGPDFAHLFNLSNI